MSAHTPHDALIRKTFDDPANVLVELRAVLPPTLFAQLDPSSLSLCQGTFVDQELHRAHTDVLYTGRVAGQDLYFYFLLEHLSTRDELAPFRLLAYQLSIWKKHLAEHEHQLPLPPIIPIVLHHSEQGWKGSLGFDGLFAPELFDLEPSLRELVPNYRFLLDDLSHQSDAALRARAVTESERVVSVVLWALRDARNAERIATSLLAWAQVLAEVADSPRGIEALRSVFTYISLVSDRLSRHDLLQAIDGLAPPAKELLMTPAQQWIQEGEQRGIALGKTEGERHLLLRLLRAKFGELPASIEARVAVALEPELLTWSERVLTATVLDGLFDG